MRERKFGKRDLIYRERDENAMLRLFLQLLRNEDGYTAVECGTLACLTVIFAEKLVS